MSNFVEFIFLLSITQFLFNFVDSQRYNYLNSFPEYVGICMSDYGIGTPLFFKCIINVSKNNTELLIDFLNEEKNYPIIRSLITFIPKFSNIVKLIDILEDSVKQKTELMNYLNDTFKYKDNSNLTFFDYLDNIVDNLNTIPLNFKNVLTNFSSLFQIPGLNKAFYYIRDKDENITFEVIDLIIDFLGNNSEVKNIYDLLVESLGKYRNKIMVLFFELIINYADRIKLITLISDFLKENKEVHEGIKYLLKKKEFQNILNKVLIFDNAFAEAIKEVIFEREEALDIFFQLLNDTNIMDEGVKIIINIENGPYILEKLPTLLKNISNLDETFLPKFIRNIMYVSGKSHGKNSFINYIVKQTQISVKSLFGHRNISDYNISNNCTYLFHKTFFNNNTNSNLDQTLLTYLRKVIFDSPINKGDFMSFENCLSEKPIEVEGDEKNNAFSIKPAFIIGIVEEKEKINYLNTTFYDKFHYITNFCLPFGFTINSDNNEVSMCSDNDYNQILKFLLNFVSESNNSDISDVVWYDNKTKLNSSDYLIGIFSLLILAIPIIIRIVLLIKKYISEQKYKKLNKIKKLNQGRNFSKTSTYTEEEIKSIQKPKASKSQKLLNSFFSFYQNGKELFNFNLNNTNFNNINGITYIKGLIGFSIILNIFGLTFTILMNIQIKDYGIYHFYRTMTSFLFVFLYVGYRYSPRVLFSCSGYTLTYKYLCFIEQEKGLYFLKFIFLQSYKYIFLYFVLIFFDYSIIRIFCLFRDAKRPVWALFEYFMKKETFLVSSFALLLDFNRVKEESLNQNLIYNFYMPINEIFFFLFGTILISLGYRFKLRIDFIILVLIIASIILKIIIYFAFSGSKFITTDYYTFNLGLLLINPLYNISYFLTGMYFGLINYSIQKGITNIYKKNQYNKYYKLEESNKSNENLNDENSLYAQLNINEDDSKYNQKSDINNPSENSKEKFDKYLSNKEQNFEGKSDNELIEQIKNMPFLKSPIQFLNLNRKNKDRIWYKILSFIAIILMIFLCYTKTIFVSSSSFINIDMEREEYRTNISLIKVISNTLLNIINIIDIDIIVFLSQWIIFLLFFKDVTLIREFCNSIYWSFFVKSYYSYLLISVPVILCILYESEFVIKLHIYNFILFSLINIVYIFVFVILFYSIYELPLKKIFKKLLKRNEIIEEEEEEEEEDEEEEPKEEEIMEFADEEEEDMNLKK